MGEMKGCYDPDGTHGGYFDRRFAFPPARFLVDFAFFFLVPLPLADFFAVCFDFFPPADDFFFLLPPKIFSQLSAYFFVPPTLVVPGILVNSPDQ